jgi:hypothetical protein
MAFKKGQSGNPTGRGKPKTGPELQAWIKLNKLTPMAVDVLEETMTTGTKDSVTAAINVLDRVWGKPKQQIDASLSGGINITVTIKEKKPS